jgi:hypothetical protein
MDYRLRRISSLWISAGELDPKKDTVVTIERITTEDVIGPGGKVSTMGVAYFRGWKKGWPINSGCGDLIRKMYGADDDGWIGKPIALYRAITKVGGDPRVPCIRVRPEPPKVGRADPQPAAPEEDDAALVARVCGEMKAATSAGQVEAIAAANRDRIGKAKPELRKLALDTKAEALAKLPKEAADGAAR